MRAPELLGFLGGPGDSRSRADIGEVRAELEHHLACAAEDLAATGLPPEQAWLESLRRFGDVGSIERRCLRIRTEGRTMLNRLHLSVTVLLALCVAYLWFTQQVRLMQGEAELDHALALARQGEARPVGRPLIQVGDVLELVDFVNPGLRAKETVAGDGKILVPSVGWVSVAGLDREQAEQALTEALQPYYVETDVKLKVLKASDMSSVPFESY